MYFMKGVFCIYAICFWCNFLLCQRIQGKIIDSKTHQPLPYVNIGIVNKSTGTVSDSAGQFNLVIQQEPTRDTMILSMIGYQSCAVSLDSIYNKQQNIIFELAEKSYGLQEVTIRPTKIKRKILGNKQKGQPCVYFLGDSLKDYTGSEIGTIIKLKNSPAIIEEINFSICENDYNSLTIRVNIYDVVKNINILKQPIYTQIKKDQKYVQISLHDYGIVLENDFIIALESIELINMSTKKARKKFGLSGGFIGSDLMTRKSIFDPRTRESLIVLGINATVIYEKL